MDTIFALATARGRAGIAVIRLSGPKAFDAVAAMKVTLPEVRRAGLRRLYDGELLLDEAVVLLFDDGASFTGEKVAELHVHGSIAITTAVLGMLARQPGVRLAEAGEFTRRALENGRLDLTQVEGLADLIDAETEAQRRQALRVLSGSIGQKAEEWRTKLIRAAALVEATIDFADEDVPIDVTPEVTDLIEHVRAELEREIAGSFAAERIRDGYEVAIIGAPNSGKSTLLNRLAGRDAAITSDVAGTTRDIIEVRMTLAGLPVTFLDTAGLRDAEDQIEKIGIDRAISRATHADLRVFLDDGQKLMLAPSEGDIVLRAKDDNGKFEGISGQTGYGIDNLVERISRQLQSQTANAATITHVRHRHALTTAVSELDTLGPNWPSQTPEIGALTLRQATLALDSLIGRVNVENLLDEIFLSFCIGK